MGAEAYGLVGVFSMLQAWFSILDFGLTPTIGRESARYHGGTLSSISYRQLFRALSLVFIIISLIGGIALYSFSGVIAKQWLVSTSLGLEEMIFSIKIMAIVISLRWLSGLFRGVISGAEKLVWLSSFNILLSTVRFPLSLAVLYIIGPSPIVFFSYQMFVAVVEFCTLAIYGYSLLPSLESGCSIGWSLKPIRSLLKFSLGIAFTSSVWVVLTQLDKLILSGILPLSDYGFFTLSVLAASVVFVVSGPISSALMPRMARLHAEAKSKEIIDVYRNYTQVVSVIAGTLTFLIVFFADSLLFTWTGNRALSEGAAKILRLYVLGNFFVSVGAFPYYLQYAIGNIKLHFIGNTLTLIVLIPVMIYSSKVYGGVGAGVSWLVTNAIFFILWVPFVHHRLLPNLHLKWLLHDFLKICLPCISLLMIVSNLDLPEDRWLLSINLLLLSILAVTVSLLASPFCRGAISSFIKKRFMH